MWELLRSWRGKEPGAPKAPEHAVSPVHRHYSVTFKDCNISNVLDETDEPVLTPEDSDMASALPSPCTSKLKRMERTKLIMIMVGLPGRGKTFLCNKLVCYLNWLGHQTKLFNVGSYRRKQKDTDEVQDASFFDKNNQAGLEARQRALQAALDDLKLYLDSDMGQVAIFDATNTTNERRQFLVSEFHGRYQYLFIESICTDKEVLEQNYQYKMRYSPDYKGMSEEQALADFKQRIKKYEEVYEPLEDRTRHYIKLIDMVTGRGHMDINRISGYIPGKIVFFLMQVCKAGMAQERKIWLTRHGESLFNVQGRIGGNAGLSARGQEYAHSLPEVLLSRLPMTPDDQPIPVSVWTSTLRRTIETADYLVFPKLRWKALDEIHAGSCDGLTYEEIAERFPHEYEARTRDKLRYRYPAGESYLDVIQRLEPVVIELEREKECVCVVAHQAVLRAVYGYFTGVAIEDIPTLDIPLHSLMELRPRPDGTMEVEILPVMQDPGTGMHPSLPPARLGGTAALHPHHPYYTGPAMPGSSAHAGGHHRPPNSDERVSPTSSIQPPTGGIVGAPGPAAMVFPAIAEDSATISPRLHVPSGPAPFRASPVLAAGKQLLQQVLVNESKKQESGQSIPALDEVSSLADSVEGASASFTSLALEGLRIASGAVPPGPGLQLQPPQPASAAAGTADLGNSGADVGGVSAGGAALLAATSVPLFADGLALTEAAPATATVVVVGQSDGAAAGASQLRVLSPAVLVDAHSAGPTPANLVPTPAPAPSGAGNASVVYLVGELGGIEQRNFCLHSV